MKEQYDYIIAGAGASGLSLAWKLRQSLKNKNVLVVDQNLSPEDDKTWCFWDDGSPPFTDIICQKWHNVEVNTSNGRLTQPLHQYCYYCIRSIDFQKKILQDLSSHPNFDLLESSITGLDGTNEQATLYTPDQSITGDYIFQSCFNPWNKDHDHPHFPLLQHFLGWEIVLNKPLFDEDIFTLMDFDDTFSDGVSFIYLLPWSQTSALIEYTIFSEQPISESQYEEKISLYLYNRFNLKPIDYRIVRKEHGLIPMQDRPHKTWYQPRVMNMGTLGGFTKPSTGYTFRRIQNHTDAIVEGLLSEGIPRNVSPSEFRYKAYDLWLLQIIHGHPADARRVFTHLFQNNSMDDVFRFLGEETSYKQDLKIMASVPHLPFLRAIWKTKKRLREIS